MTFLVGNRALAALWLPLLLTGCSSEETTPPGASSSVSAGQGGQGGEGQGGAGGAFTGSGSGGGQCGLTCSGDLHSVVDCNGVLTATCPPDQGCADGACIPACEAAIANKSSIGCDYYAHNPVTIFGRGCHAMFIANTWNAPVTISGEANGSAIDLSKFAYLPSGTGQAMTLTPLGAGGALPPNEVAIVFLRDAEGFGVACPMPAAETDAMAGPWTDGIAGTGNQGQSLRVFTSAPVVAYDIIPFGGGSSEISDASLLLPTSTWDTNYIAITPRPLGDNTLNPTLAIVAAEDATTVTILPTVAIAPGAGVAGGPANVAQVFPLSRGQVLRFEQAEDLLGSVISADKPVGVWGEQGCINIDESACDAAHEQIPPVRALGSEYVSVRYRNRVDGLEEQPPVRITGAIDGTQLVWEPAAPSGAVDVVGRGQSFEVRSTTPFIVRSQDADHPFYVAAYMTGGKAFADGRGDPEFVNVIPSGQYLSDYTFFTDPTYPETNLVFVRKRGTDGFADVTLECSGVLGGWAPIDAGGVYEFVRADLSSGQFQGQNGCDNGLNRAFSALPFGLTVWGWGTEATGSYGQPGYSQYVSYAYPAGASVQTINEVIVPPVPR
jgi:hypothetical protein